MESEFIRAALWGVMGGFIYAGPRLTACVYVASQTGATCRMCCLDFAVGIIAAAAASAAFTPALLAQGWTWFGKPGPHQLPALSCVVGYAFHQVGPALVEGLKSRVAAIIAGGKEK